MSTPDPESAGFLAKIVAAGVAIYGPIIGGFLWLDNRFAKKHTVGTQFQKVENEIHIQRQHIAKLFDKMEEHARRDEDLHRKMMATIAENHAELLRELGKKADRHE